MSAHECMNFYTLVTHVASTSEGSSHLCVHLNIFLLFWLYWVLLRHTETFIVAHRRTCPTASGTLGPRPGIELASPAVEGEPPTTGPLGKPPCALVSGIVRRGLLVSGSYHTMPRSRLRESPLMLPVVVGDSFSSLYSIPVGGHTTLYPCYSWWASR